jgi:DNA-binding response OmpR family regulator
MEIGKAKDLSTAAELRRQAEERLCGKTVELHPPPDRGSDTEVRPGKTAAGCEGATMNHRLPRILCVDDEPKNLSLLEAMLSPRGYDVVSAASGLEALEKIRTERIDLCLLDVIMPGMDGFEVCRLIKSDDLNRNIPVVMITIYTDMKNRIRGIEAGADDYISKPFDSVEVLARIKMLLHVKSLVDELRQKDQLLILQDRLAVMGETINNIAHQWRQPLNTLGLLIQQLPLFYDSNNFSREFLEENTGKSMELIQHMSQTIEAFRNFFKPDKEMVTFGVNLVIRNTLALIGESLKEQQIDIALHLEGDPMANGYPNEYAQVLLNILMNARDAVVGHNGDDTRILIHAFAEGGTSVVTISDNAGGIANEIIGRLFDPYFTTKGPDKGTGIGLFMSKTIIEKSMGGRLTVRNTGNGAEFRIEV